MTDKIDSMDDRGRGRIWLLLAGCLWLVSTLLLLPAIWIGHAYDYGPSEWLMLLGYPNDPAENGLWAFRVGLLLVFVGSTACLLVHFVKQARRKS